MSDDALPEELLHLLREVQRRGGLGHQNLVLNRRLGGGWSAKWGNTMLLSPDMCGPELERRTDWMLVEYPPPLKPLSEKIVEVGP
jgi:hypothetical protein